MNATAKDEAAKIQPYGELREVGPGVFVLDGEWHGTSFRRRMTVVRAESGGLLVHNAIRLREDDYAKLDRLGRVAWIVAPNYLHASEAHAYKRRYPDAKLFLPAKKRAEWADRTPVDGTLPADWPAELAREIECRGLAGTRYIDESVFFHRASRTLIVADLVFNLRNEPRGAERIFYRLNRIYRRFGPSRFFKYAAVRDRAEFRGAVRAILEWDFDRVIMSHGDVLETGGREAFRRGFAELGLL